MFVKAVGEGSQCGKNAPNKPNPSTRKAPAKVSKASVRLAYRFAPAASAEPTATLTALNAPNMAAPTSVLSGYPYASRIEGPSSKSVKFERACESLPVKRGRRDLLTTKQPAGAGPPQTLKSMLS